MAPPEHELAPPSPDEQAPLARPPLDAAAAEVEPLPRDPDGAAVVAGSVRAPWRWEQLLVDAAVIGGESAGRGVSPGSSASSAYAGASSAARTRRARPSPITSSPTSSISASSRCR